MCRCEIFDVLDDRLPEISMKEEFCTGNDILQHKRQHGGE